MRRLHRSSDWPIVALWSDWPRARVITRACLATGVYRITIKKSLNSLDKYFYDLFKGNFILLCLRSIFKAISYPANHTFNPPLIFSRTKDNLSTFSHKLLPLPCTCSAHIPRGRLTQKGVCHVKPHFSQAKFKDTDLCIATPNRPSYSHVFRVYLRYSMPRLNSHLVHSPRWNWSWIFVHELIDNQNSEAVCLLLFLWKFCFYLLQCVC